MAPSLPPPPPPFRTIIRDVIPPQKLPILVRLLSNIFFDAHIPADMNTRKKIVGNLLIAGSLTDFPTFPALEVVEGHININGVSQTEINNLFPALDSVRGDINIQSNASCENDIGTGRTR